ncbi:MAG: MBL fold metallo-hydrolase [Ruminococcaceae bacterium]|nr:MBL fold metallo-hydrolase [Oscillospiraceae bacterium]
MIRFITLFSGSSGNATLISGNDTNILIDAGVSCAKIVSELDKVGVNPNEIDALLITHEHIDHTSGVRVMSKKFNIPVFATEETLEGMNLYDVFPSNIRSIKKGEVFGIREFEIFPFAIPHDANNPVGYSVLAENKKYTVATDIGHINEKLLKCLYKSDTILLESNHDLDMLKNGRYSYPLKRRILGDFGHLSNDNAAWVATQLAKWGTKNIILGHLSNENNTPDLAYECAYNMLTKNDAKVGCDVILKVAKRFGITEI